MTLTQARDAGLALAAPDTTRDTLREIDHAGVRRAARDLLVGVVLEAEHLCMSLRGVQTSGAGTVTSALHGLIRLDARTRQEFLALTTRTRHDQ